MQEKSFAYTPIVPEIFSKLCYTVALGVMRTPNFTLRNFKDDNLVLIYTTKGCLFCRQNGNSFSCEEGQYLLLDKRILHSYHFDKSIPSEILWMHINGDLANGIAAQINAISGLPFLGTDRRIYDSLKEFLKIQRDGTFDPFECSSQIADVLHMILREAHTREQKILYLPEEYEFRTKVEKILRGADLSEVTLESLCTKMNLNKYYFSHRFKVYYGIPPMKYVQNLRLEKAKHLLQYPDFKISAIATQFGFASHTYFSAAFKRNFGKTPEQYRSEILNPDRDPKGEHNERKST